MISSLELPSVYVQCDGCGTRTRPSLIRLSYSMADFHQQRLWATGPTLIEFDRHIRETNSMHPKGLLIQYGQPLGEITSQRDPIKGYMISVTSQDLVTRMSESLE